MSKKAQKTLDVIAIVKMFGGKHQIVADYEKILRIILTVKAVEKWIERNQIPFGQIMSLKTIAEKRGITFVIEEHIK